MANLPGLYFLQTYPRQEIWRLFVDGRFWFKENGWRGYESREPGCLNAALESLCSIALDVDEAGESFELSVDLIKEIHKKCGKKVEALKDKNPGEIRTNEPTSFGIPANRASINGIKEFLQIFFLGPSEAVFGPGQPGTFSPCFDYNYLENISPEQTSQLAQKIYSDMCQCGHSNTNHFYLAVRRDVDVHLEAITQSYNKEIKTTLTVDEKLYTITKHIRHYEVLHPFRDANGRTFVNNLLNILLMQQGLPPATFYEPNVFDLYSTDELVVVIKEAIFNTIEIIEKNKTEISLYGYNATLEIKSTFMDKLDSPSYTKIQQMDLSNLNSEKLVKKTQDCLSSLRKCYQLHRAAIYLTESSDIKLLVAMSASQINLHINQGAPPIYVGKTPMHLSIMMHNTVMIDEIIAHADLSIPDYDGKTAVHYAAEYGTMQIIGKILNTLLVRKDAIHVLNIKDNQGKTALHYAAEFGSPEIVISLIKTGEIQINEPDSVGFSAITLAYKCHKLNIFEELLDAGAKIDQKLLDLIVHRKDSKSFRQIIKKNETILLSKVGFYVAVYLGNIRLVRKFLRAGIDIDLRLDKENLTSLMLAVSLDNIKLVEYLFRKGADTSLTDKDGATLLQYVFYASQEYRKTLLKMIVAKDKSLINKLNTNQVPPIYYALVNNENVLVLMLLDMGAKIDFEDMMGNNILHSAMSRNCLPLVQEFLSRDKTLLHKKNSAGRNPFHQALYDFPMFKYLNEKDEMMFIELSDYLFKEKVKLNEKDYNKKTILDIALSKPYFRLCVKLMKEGAHTNISSSLSFLKKYPLDSILKDAEQFKELLMKKLDGNPLVAMGQVNDLFVKIKNNDLRIPKDFAPKEGFSFFKEKTIDSTVYEKVISVLKDIYDTKLKEVIAIHCKKSDKKLKTKASFLDENLKFLIENQEISKKIDKPSVHSVEGEFYKIKW